MPLGTEKLKQALKFAIDFGKQMEVALKDKKFNWLDGFGFLDELVQIPGLVNSRDQIIAEWKDLDDTERSELLAYAKDRLDLDNDELEQKIEDSLEVVFAILKLVTPKTQLPAPTQEPADGGSNPASPPPTGDPGSGGQG